ncbi:MAG: peptide-methionine (S)-S-oxide reductase [Bacteroidetes bacterium HGW-Bacteroidetes-4]|jgi:peptide-methionine (S)-S-oxide reductase|nr:MAG: peptide-methionine (S)-S-oxide reductase [Bacteroidetes bacterium HGW-Bacteroidetes-4]
MKQKVTYPFFAGIVPGLVVFAFTLYAQPDLPILPKPETMKTELATFGGGCFWCTEAIFERLEGVIAATSGYSGGVTKNPTYKEVCTGRTGHAEVIQVEYNPDLISYTDLLEVFFKTHDPTTKNRQGADVGNQYRSIILYHNAEQQATAQQVMDALNAEKIWNDLIVTELEPFEVFYSAEAYHQEYYENNAGQMYCQMVINPKIEKFEKLFRTKLKKSQ